MSVTCLQRRTPPRFSRDSPLPALLIRRLQIIVINITHSACAIKRLNAFLIGQSERKNYMLLTSELEARPVYVWTKEHIEAHFLTCFVALTIARILENKLEQKYSVGRILDSLSKAECSLVQQNYYLFDYYDEVLKDIGLIMDIDFGKRIRTLGEIKKILAKTKK